MPEILFLLVCLALGVIVACFGKPPPGLTQGLNWWVLNVALSALVLRLIPTLAFDWNLWFLMVSMWFVFAGAWVFFAFIGRLLHWPRERVGCLTLVAGLGNTAFTGYPLIEALRGEEGLRLALIADQGGGFIALAVGGTIVGALYSGKQATPSILLRKILLFPPFVSLLVAIGAGVLGGWPEEVDQVLSRIGATLAPLALFSVGMQLTLRLDRQQMQAVALGLAWKLVLAPVIVALAGFAIGVDHLVLSVATLEAAMGPMVSSTILAEQNKLEPPLASAVLGAGVLLSFATVLIANALLG